jgi:hypothetical protein
MAGLKSRELSPRPLRNVRTASSRRPFKVRFAAAAIARRSRRKFLKYYPRGFSDSDYLELERGYKWVAHERWLASLSESDLRRLIENEEFSAIAARAVSIESRTNLLFSFEKMALRDAVKPAAGAKAFSNGLFDLLYGKAPLSERFDLWCKVLSKLPRRQTRVLTWPLATVFGFIAQPRVHFFLKPNVTRRAANNYGYDLPYQSTPDWNTYSAILKFARSVRADIADMAPRDMIDIQSFLWVQGSEEYPE